MTDLRASDAATTPATRSPLPTPSTSAQLALLSRRAVLGFFRQPVTWIFGSLFPLMIAAVSASAFSRATSLGGFPDADSYLQFLLPGTIIQGTLFGAINGSTDLATDIENGFIDRLLTSPVARSAILVARLAGSAVYGAGITVVYVGLFMLFGVEIAGGVGGVVVMALISTILAIAVGGYGSAVGLRTGSAEAVGNSFPLLFILLFISSAFFPTELMSGWYGALARNNPLSRAIDASRHQVIEGFSISEALVGLAISMAFATLMIVFAVRSLRARLAAS